MSVILTLLAICGFLYLFVTYEPQRACAQPISLTPNVQLLPDIFDCFNFDIGGVSFYQAHLNRIAGEKGVLPKNIKCIGILCREPFNWHNQYTVVLYISGYKVGRLNLEDSRAFCEFMQQANLHVETKFEVECLITGGQKLYEHESEFGIKLNLPSHPNDFKWQMLNA